LTKEIQLALIDDNPFNVRIRYTEAGIKDLAESLVADGLISPIKVREAGQRYQIVFGHRRARAARMLRWETIRAEVDTVSDHGMLRTSLVENVQRHDITDYEKALAFVRMSGELGINYSEVGRLVGYSRQHVHNYVKMTQLFTEETLSKDPSLLEGLHKMTEHHARILLRIGDEETRVKTLKLVLAENLSVRDLERVMGRLRSWFTGPETDRPANSVADEKYRSQRSDELEMKKGLMDAFSLPHSGDIESFFDIYAFDRDFSFYGAFPPYERFEREAARRKLGHWFREIAPYYREVLRDIKVRIMKDVALATLYVDYEDPKTAIKATARGTVVFLRTRNKWKIIHLHWSSLKSPFEILEDQHRRPKKNR